MKWESINNFEDYLINDSGDNNKSVWSKKSNKFLKGRLTPSKYVQICFTVDGVHYFDYLHKLIAEAFIPNSENKPTVNHKNHVRDDNRLDNLEWATYTEQCDEIMRENVSKARKGQHNSPKTEFKPKGKIIQSEPDGTFVKLWDSAKQIERELGYQQTNISRCCNGGYYEKGKWINVKQHKGYKWSYKPL